MRIEPAAVGARGWFVVAVFTATVLLSTFMPNTAASNLLLPIGISAAVGLDGGTGVREVATAIALAASRAMALPVSTPPNALGNSRGRFAVRDMALPGVLIGVAGASLVAFCVEPLIRFWSRLL